MFSPGANTIYYITYELNGGINAPGNPENYTIETDTITLLEPQREGFIFDGWYIFENFGGQKQTSIKKGMHTNRILYAKWLKKYTVSYLSEYGSIPNEVTVAESTKLSSSQLPELTDSTYLFDGWYIGDSKLVAEEYSVKDDITLMARWNKKCTVSYSSEYGTIPDSFDTECGSVLHTNNLPKLMENGWKFKGWYTNNTYDKDKKAVAKQYVTTDITLYAKWEEFDGIYDNFVFVGGGSFYMGDKSSTRLVEITNGFYICDHELTQSEYEEYCCYKDLDCIPNSEDGVGNEYPVYYVSWYDAIVYCNLKSIAEGLEPCYSISGEIDPTQWNGIKEIDGKYCSATSLSVSCNFKANGYRLPTEAEWEFAARGGNKSKKYIYSGSDIIYSVGWASTDTGRDSLHEIKKLNPNELGLYDMSGNVEEWCWDRFGKFNSYTTEVNPSGPSSGTTRVTRGGSSSTFKDYCTVYSRRDRDPNRPLPKLGFRLVRSANTDNGLTE